MHLLPWNTQNMRNRKCMGFKSIDVPNAWKYNAWKPKKALNRMGYRFSWKLYNRTTHKIQIELSQPKKLFQWNYLCLWVHINIRKPWETKRNSDMHSSFYIVTNALLESLGSHCRFLVPDNTQKILTEIWHHFWLENDDEKWSRFFHFEILHAPSELLLPSAKKKSAQKGWIGLAG